MHRKASREKKEFFMPKPTIYTIAKAAGCSTTTVSKILNNQGNISAETTARVMAIIKELNYVPQQRKQHGNAIGVIMFQTNQRPLASPFVATLLNGVCREAFGRGRDITLLDGERISKLTPEELHCFYASNSLSGLLVINLSESDPFCARLRASDLPYVILANSGTSRNSVSSRNYEAASEMIDYICCMGHTRIAFVGVVVNSYESHVLRLKAYKETLTKHGIPIRPEFIADMPDLSHSTIKNTLLRLFAHPQPPTALFFASEDMEILPVIEQMGLKIPEDISVAGMTIKRQNNANKAELATIVQPIEEIGKCGIELLLDLLNGHEPCDKVLDCQINYGDTIRRI